MTRLLDLMVYKHLKADQRTCAAPDDSENDEVSRKSVSATTMTGQNMHLLEVEGGHTAACGGSQTRITC